MYVYIIVDYRRLLFDHDLLIHSSNNFLNLYSFFDTSYNADFSFIIQVLVYEKMIVQIALIDRID